MHTETIGMTENSAIDRLMESHGLEREEAQEIIGELQADTEEPFICGRCGAYTDRDEYTVVQVRETLDEPEAMCTACFATYLDENANLTEKQAMTTALYEDGYSYEDIAEYYGKSNSASQQNLRYVREKREEAIKLAMLLGPLERV